MGADAPDLSVALTRGVGQIVRAALQTSPEGLVARAAIRLLPAGSAILRSTEKEPLGAWVTALVLITSLPSRRARTFQRTPSRFWSTSN